MKELEHKDYGLVRVAAVTPRLYLADVERNTAEIIRLAEEAARKEASIVVFPELCITGYSCADLFGQQRLLEAVQLRRPDQGRQDTWHCAQVLSAESCRVL